MTVESKESALSRWSRRKAEAQQAEATVTEPVDAETGPEQAAIGDALPAAADDQPLLTDADMPDVEDLDEKSDFSPFMSPGVSDELRNLALRKLFRAPVFNIRDGLDEYDEDFTTFEKLGDIVTADMKHQIEMQQQKLREKLAAEGEADMAEAHAEGIDEIEDEMVEEIEDDEQAPSPDSQLADASDAVQPKDKTDE